MAETVGEYGPQHKKDELVATFEFNLEELYDLESQYSYRDGARRDIQAAIAAIEERQKARDEARESMPGLSIVVTEFDPGGAK